jgi:hypothetical protein
MDVDEVALNTLLADGVDAPTAYAASVRDEPQPAVNQSTNWFAVGVLVGGLVVFLLLLLR